MLVPLTLLDIFPATLPWLHPHWVYMVSPSPAGRGAANDAVNSTDAGLRDEESEVASPPHFHLCSLDAGRQLRLARC